MYSPNSFYNVYLDGIGLHDLDPSIVITDVQEPAPQLDVQTVMLADRPGECCARQLRKNISVIVKLRIITSSFDRRKAVWRRVNAWAVRGGLLTISDRHGQQLRVRLATPLALPSTLKWTDELSMTFTSMGLPYWQDVYPSTATLTAGSGSAVLSPSGDVDTLLEVTAINKSNSPLTRLRIEVGGHFIALEGMSIPSGGSVRLYYDDEHILQLPVEARTEDSSDELPLSCQAANTITFSADQSVAITFSARGCYL